MKRIRGIFLFFVLCVFTGCVAYWTTVDKTTTMSTGDFKVTVPGGWSKYYSDSNTSMFYLTKDGNLLQYVVLNNYAVGAKLANTAKEFTDQMLLQEVADLLAAEFAADKTMPNFKLLANVPVTMDGKEAFRLEYSYDNVDGVVYKGVTYGFKYKKSFWTLNYRAVDTYYFAKDSQVFDKMIDSFKIPAVGNNVNTATAK